MQKTAFYQRGMKVAFEMLGLIKTALTPGRMLLGGIGRGAARGAATGALTGGVGGAIAAPEGEGGSGFLRGMGYGALTGGLVGGGAGGLKTRAFQKAHPEYVNRTNRAVERQAAPVQHAGQDLYEGPLPRSTNENIQRAMPASQAHQRVMDRLQTGGKAGLVGGLVGGGAAGLTTEKKSPVDDLRGRLGL